MSQRDEGDEKEVGDLLNSRLGKEVDLRVKWWYWVLLGLGCVMVIGGIICAVISGMFG